MEKQQVLELIVESRDETLISEIERSLAAVQPARGRTARPVDPITILGIAAGVVKLVNELLALKKNLASRKDPPQVKVRNLAGETVELSNATEESLTNLLR